MSPMGLLRAASFSLPVMCSPLSHYDCMWTCSLQHSFGGTGHEPLRGAVCGTPPPFGQKDVSFQCVMSHFSLCTFHLAVCISDVSVVSACRIVCSVGCDDA